MTRGSGTIFSVAMVGAMALAATTSCTGGKTRRESEAMWGSERVCLPCHAYRLPIARQHNYRCDTCHGGSPTAKDKDVAHRDLFPRPQDEAVIQYTCQKCHNEKLGRDVPYDSEFVKDVLISHGDYAE